MNQWRPEIEAIEGRFVAASNATLLASTVSGERVIYKPTAGERPLWDFPVDTLAVREVLTYEMSEAMGLGVVPETVLGHGPLGIGSVQRYVEHDDDFDPIDVVRKADAALWPIAVLDVLTNNADRKLGHILRSDARLWAIDHGLTFHPEDKLRTVLWCFAGLPFPPALFDAIRRFEGAVRGDFGRHVIDRLGRPERDALLRRVRQAIDDGVHPEPPIDRPPLPWPPY